MKSNLWKGTYQFPVEYDTKEWQEITIYGDSEENVKEQAISKMRYDTFGNDCEDSDIVTSDLKEFEQEIIDCDLEELLDDFRPTAYIIWSSLKRGYESLKIECVNC